MSKAIDKEKLLECFRSMENDRWLNKAELIEAIESGAFDLPADTDTIGELDAYTRMMHERNERLERELDRSERDVQRWKMHLDVEKSANLVRQEIIDELKFKLNTALEALEWIRDAGTDYQSINKARQAIQAIKGEIV